MRKVIKKFGLEGYACYFILLELCFDKIKKSRDQKFTEDHFQFRLEETEVLQKFRMRATRVELLLNYYVTCELLHFTKVEDEFHFEIPKILKLLDREQRRARPKGGADHAECGPEEKRVEESRVEENNNKKSAFDFDAAYSLYPLKMKGPKAEQNFHSQMKTQADYDNLIKALLNYKTMLEQESWRKPKGTFAAFLGSKSTGFFWRDWIQYEVPVQPDKHAAGLAALERLREERRAEGIR